MLAEILTIGDEICRGEIVDTNSSWLAAQLWELGVTPAWLTSCADLPADMQRAFADAVGRADVVIVSGGLGPTVDDLTVDVLAEMLGVEAVVDAASLARMGARYMLGGRKSPANAERQTRVPAGAEVFLNPVGAAPGFGVQLAGRWIYCMPGVPRELKAIFAEHLVARLQTARAGEPPIARRKLRVFGVGESQVDNALAGLIDGVPGATLHFQVRYPETFVKLVVRGADSEVVVARLAAEARRRLGKLVYGEGEELMPHVLGRALAGRKLSVAESCTGGLLGSMITEVPGSSAYFQGGWIVYANDAKVRELGVSAQTLAAHGAVSVETAREMATGARERGGGDLAVAITGIAGPDGGTPDKPVGTVCIAVAGPRGVRDKRYVWPGSRDQVRLLAAFWAMSMLLEEIAE